MFGIAEVVSEPVVEACAGECSLRCFQKKYTIYYKTYVSEKNAVTRWKSSHAKQLYVPIVAGKVVAIHVLL
jgi:hypothetical protein